MIKGRVRESKLLKGKLISIQKVSVLDILETNMDSLLVSKLTGTNSFVLTNLVFILNN